MLTLLQAKMSFALIICFIFFSTTGDVSAGITGAYDNDGAGASQADANVGGGSGQNSSVGSGSNGNNNGFGNDPQGEYGDGSAGRPGGINQGGGNNNGFGNDPQGEYGDGSAGRPGGTNQAGGEYGDGSAGRPGGLNLGSEYDSGYGSGRFGEYSDGSAGRPGGQFNPTNDYNGWYEETEVSTERRGSTALDALKLFGSTVVNGIGNAVKVLRPRVETVTPNSIPSGIQETVKSIPALNPSSPEGLRYDPTYNNAVVTTRTAVNALGSIPPAEYNSLTEAAEIGYVAQVTYKAQELLHAAQKLLEEAAVAATSYDPRGDLGGDPGEGGLGYAGPDGTVTGGTGKNQQEALDNARSIAAQAQKLADDSRYLSDAVASGLQNITNEKSACGAGPCVRENITGTARPNPTSKEYKDKLQEVVNALQSKYPGLSVDIWSGTTETPHFDPAKGNAGSGRHAHGMGGDLTFSIDGETVTDERILQDIVQTTAVIGEGEIGIGYSYKTKTITHLDFETNPNNGYHGTWAYHGSKNIVFEAAFQKGKNGILPDNVSLDPITVGPTGALTDAEFQNIIEKQKNRGSVTRLAESASPNVTQSDPVRVSTSNVPAPATVENRTLLGRVADGATKVLSSIKTFFGGNTATNIQPGADEDAEADIDPPVIQNPTPGTIVFEAMTTHNNSVVTTWGAQNLYIQTGDDIHFRWRADTNFVNCVTDLNPVSGQEIIGISGNTLDSKTDLIEMDGYYTVTCAHRNGRNKTVGIRVGIN